MDVTNFHALSARFAESNDLIVDPSQAIALAACLSREIALIQGPPGTGNSNQFKPIVQV